MDRIRTLEILNRELEIENKILKEKQRENKKVIQELEEQKNILKEKLEEILNSRSYKVIQKMKKIIKRG